MNEVALKKIRVQAAFDAQAMERLQKDLDQARQDAKSDAIVARRIAFLELGLRWTFNEARAHAFLADAANADKKAARQTLDDRFTLMQEVFQKAPLALNVAYISWGEDGLWSQLGWAAPKRNRQP